MIVELAEGRIVVVFAPLRSWMVLVCANAVALANAIIVPTVTIILFNAHLEQFIYDVKLRINFLILINTKNERARLE